jgi:hypothetical protein
VPRCQWHAPIEAEERDPISRGIFLAVSKSASVTGVVTTNVNGDYRCNGQRLGNVGPTFGCRIDGAGASPGGAGDGPQEPHWAHDGGAELAERRRRLRQEVDRWHARVPAVPALIIRVAGTNGKTR